MPLLAPLVGLDQPGLALPPSFTDCCLEPWEPVAGWCPGSGSRMMETSHRQQADRMHERQPQTEAGGGAGSSPVQSPSLHHHVQQGDAPQPGWGTPTPAAPGACVLRRLACPSCLLVCLHWPEEASALKA